jgi:hypothetical protein
MEIEPGGSSAKPNDAISKSVIKLEVRLFFSLIFFNFFF